MRQPRTLLFVVSQVFSVLILTSATHAGQKHRHVNTWRAVGQRWAAALDSSGKATAIYDLAYPHWSKTIYLGLIGNRRTNKEETLEILEAAKNLPDANVAEIDDAILKLTPIIQGPLFDGAMPDQWWNKVSWRNSQKPQQPPEHFLLSDINTGASLTANPKMRQALTKLSRLISETEDQTPNTNILSQFAFDRDAGGGYSMSFLPPAELIRTASGPRKLCDLTSTKWAFNQSLKIEAIKALITEGTAAGASPVVNAFISTAVDRFFHFYENMIRAQENMLLEELTMINEKTSAAAQFGLSETEREAAAEALIFSQEALEVNWRWKWKDAHKRWQKLIKQNADYVNKSTQWISAHHQTLRPLNARFGVTTDDQTHRRMVILAQAKKPITAVDYGDFTSLRRKRLDREFYSAGLIFAANLVSAAGTVVSEAIKRYIEKPIDADKVWEARLLVVLDDRSRELNEDYTKEISVLETQRVNPFTERMRQTRQLIAQRKALIGLP